jgi:hypothetical protein
MIKSIQKFKKDIIITLDSVEANIIKLNIYSIIDKWIQWQMRPEKLAEYFKRSMLQAKWASEKSKNYIPSAGKLMSIAQASPNSRMK